MSFPIPDSVLKNVRVLASDIDDTFTINGVVVPENIALVNRLRHAGIKVYLVTGRTAGHGYALTTYFDLDGVIAENGGVICENEHVRLCDDFVPGTLEKIKKTADELIQRYPQIKYSDDNFMRMTDRAFEVSTFPMENLEQARAFASKSGLAMIYSSIHMHVCDPAINKGRTLLPFLQSKGFSDMEQVITIGDSPNDEGFFDNGLFPNSVGVKNVEKYWDLIEKKPRYVLTKEQGRGFAELALRLLDAH